MDECTICMSNIPNYDDRLTCSHNKLFCSQCIDECINHHIYECPICKTRLNVPIVNTNENQLHLLMPPNTVVIARFRRNPSSEILNNFYKLCLMIYLFYIFVAILRSIYIATHSYQT